MDKSVNKLKNEIRAELMMRKSGRRTAKYGHLTNDEVYILALALTRNSVCWNARERKRNEEKQKVGYY